MKTKLNLFPFALLFSVISGALFGYFYPKAVSYIEPIGQAFLNLLLTAIVPFIFFSVSASTAQLAQSKAFSKLMFLTLMTFIITGLIASLYMICLLEVLPLTTSIIPPVAQQSATSMHQAPNYALLFSVNEFGQLFSQQHILPLIIFSMLVGLATASQQQNTYFLGLLQQGNAIFLTLITFVMKIAPIGFFAYFATISKQLGATILKDYSEIFLFYYVASTFYCLIFFSLYIYIISFSQGIKAYWQRVFTLILTALATCSSAASIPVSLKTAKAIGVPDYVAESVIPLATVLQKQGSILGASIKIIFLFSVYHLDMTSTTILSAMLVSVLVGCVMGAIPSGGMMGELLILSVFQFPAEALIMISVIGVIIDPIATIVNVLGANLNSMIVSRLMAGKSWSQSVNPSIS